MLSNHIAMWMEKLLITTFLCFFESLAIFEIRVRIQTLPFPKSANTSDNQNEPDSSLYGRYFIAQIQISIYIKFTSNQNFII